MQEAFQVFGRGGMNPKQLQKMMKQMGIEVEELSDVEEVIIRLTDKELIIPSPQVQITKAKGQKTYQVIGKAQERELEPEISDEDVEMVMEQADVDKESARQALKNTDGDIAQAIIDLEES